MKFIIRNLKGKGPLIVSSVAGILFLATVVSLVMDFVRDCKTEDTVQDHITEQRGSDSTEEQTEYYYGVSSDSVHLVTDKIGRGQSLSTMLAQYGVSVARVQNMVDISKGVFDTRSLKAGYDYTVLLSNTDGAIEHFIYQINPIDYVFYSFTDSTITVEKRSKPVETIERSLYVTVNSSLWESVVKAGGTAALVIGIENILQWTVDFYGIKKGDSFTLIYDEQVVDGESIGYSVINAAAYRQKGKSKYALYFDDENVKGYWDEHGNSLKRAFLKAPLRFSRISSKFTYNRLHPVYKIYRPHTGVDYAAPSGTPVESVADGVVIEKGYKGGGGNTIKIKHFGGSYMTGYLHLSRYAKGVNVGSRVSQGQVIGYVGSTGASTGPHLDFRVWKEGKPIDPLKLDSKAGEPLDKVTKDKYLSMTASLLKKLKEKEAMGEREISKDELRRLELERKQEEQDEMKIGKEIYSSGDEVVEP